MSSEAHTEEGPMTKDDLGVVKAVFFDVGSTLIDPNPDIGGVFHEVAGKRGHRLSLGEVDKHMDAVYGYYEEEYTKDGDFWCSPQGSIEIYLDMYRYLSHLTGLTHEAERLARDVYDCYLQPEYWGIIDDVLPCLKALKMQHIRLGVISNWAPNLEDLLRDLMLLPYFDEVISSALVGYRKPNPMIFTLMLERMGLQPHEAVHVGDKPDADGAGAHAAGVRPVIIDRSGRCTDCRYHRVQSLNELPALFQNGAFSDILV